MYTGMWCLDWDGSRRTTSTWATPSCQTLKTCSAVVGQVDVAEPSPVLCGVDAKPVLCGVEASPVLVAIRIDTRPEKSAYWAFERWKYKGKRSNVWIFEHWTGSSFLSWRNVKSSRRGKGTKRKAINPPSPRRLRSRK